jgi:hypothetical protein
MRAVFVRCTAAKRVKVMEEYFWMRETSGFVSPEDIATIGM